MLAPLVRSLICTSVLASAASGQWADDFDAYPVNIKLAGQGGWEEWDLNTAGSQTKVVDVAMGAAVRSAPHSIWTRGTSDTVYDWGVNQPGTYTSGRWVFSAYVYKPTTTTSFSMSIPQFLIMLNKYDHNSTSNNWSVQTDFSPLTGNYTIDTATTSIAGAAVFDQWVEFRAEIDLDQDTVELFYNGASTGAVYPWNGGVSGFGTGNTEIDALDLFANGAQNPQSRIYWDDFSLQPAGALTFCGAGTSGNFCQAQLSAVGDASPTQGSGFTVSVANAEGATTGMFFYSQNGQQALPWKDTASTICVRPPQLRGGLMSLSGTSGSCDGGVSQDLNARWCQSGCPKPAQAPVPGTKLQLQFWYRDASAPFSEKSAMSDAIEVDVLP